MLAHENVNMTDEHMNIIESFLNICYHINRIFLGYTLPCQGNILMMWKNILSHNNLFNMDETLKWMKIILRFKLWKIEMNENSIRIGKMFKDLHNF